MRHIALTVTFLAVACSTGLALAGPEPQSLRVTPSLLQELRAAHPTEIGPLNGYRCVPVPRSARKACAWFHVYYARYGRKEYAAADFWNRVTGGTDATEKFERTIGGRWRDLGDGWPPNCGFPPPVVEAWRWEPCN